MVLMVLNNGTSNGTFLQMEGRRGEGGGATGGGTRVYHPASPTGDYHTIAFEHLGLCCVLTGGLIHQHQKMRSVTRG